MAIRPTLPLAVALAASRDSGPNDRDHGNDALELVAERRQRRRGRRVAGDDEQLGAPVEQDAGELAGELGELRRGAVAVGEARGVAEVEEVLVGKRHEALVQNGEPADAGVENGDGQGAIGAATGDNGGRRGGTPPTERYACVAESALR